MIETTRSIWRAATFIISFIVLVFWDCVPIIFGTGDSSAPSSFQISHHLGIVITFTLVRLLVDLLGIMLHAFLLYRIFASLRHFASLTDRLDTFFYEDRRGGLALTALCVIWGISSFIMFDLSLYSLLMNASEPSTMTKVLGSEVASFACSLMIWISPFVFLGLLVWNLVTAARTLWRIIVPRRQHIEEVPLGPDEEQGDDQGDSWKHNTS